MQIIPKDIKNVYKISLIITIIVFILGLILKIPEMYLAFTIGSIFSLLTTYLLIKDVYNLVYVKNIKNYANVFGRFKRLALFIIGMLLVVYLSRKFYPNLVRSNIIFTGLGFMNFKISLFINQKIKKFAK